MAAKLHPYQIEAVEAIRQDWYGQHPNTLLVMATGGGKTIVVLDLLTTEIPKCNGRGILLVQRNELVDQPRSRIRQFWPEWDRLSGTIQAHENDTDARLTVASVQSLIQPRRMKALLSHGPITHIVCDESHHIVSKIHVSIINQLREANPDLKLLGVTATPVRGDKKGLIEIFSHVAARYDIRLLIKLGYLVPITGMAVETGANIAKTRKGEDYDGESVAQIFGKANVWELVVESHKKYASDRKLSLCFTPDVKSAYALAEAFRSSGISAEAVDGTTPTEERRAVINRFRSGKTSVLSNCGVFLEGFDVPQIDCIHWCRPTTSDSLYSQGLGRGLRTYPGKQNCIAEGQRVLTDQGLVRIEKVTRAMKVWDGTSFVTHKGAKLRGEQEVITYAGLIATADHRVWTRTGWRSFQECSEMGIPIAVTGLGRTAIRETRGYRRGSQREGRNSFSASENGTSPLYDSMSNVWGNRLTGLEQSASRDRRVPPVRSPSRCSQVVIPAGANGVRTLPESSKQDVPPLWSEGDTVPVRFPDAHGSLDSEIPRTSSRTGNRSNQQRWSLRARESALGQWFSECLQWSFSQILQKVPCFQIEVSRCSLRRFNTETPDSRWPDCDSDTGKVLPAFTKTKRRVWDLLNAGPNHRFTVEGLLVSNCLVLDYCPADYRNIVLAGDILGRLSSEGGEVGADDAADSREHGGEAFAVDAQGNLDYGDPNTLIARSLDYLNATPYEWHLENNRATLAIKGWNGSFSQTLEIHLARNGACYLMLITNYGHRVPPRVSKIATGSDVQELIAQGSAYADQHADAGLVQRGRAWRQQPPSPAQLDMLHWFDVPSDRLESLSKGEASRLITHFQAQQALERFSETVRR